MLLVFFTRAQSSAWRLTKGTDILLNEHTHTHSHTQAHRGGCRRARSLGTLPPSFPCVNLADLRMSLSLASRSFYLVSRRYSLYLPLFLSPHGITVFAPEDIPSLELILVLCENRVFLYSFGHEKLGNQGIIFKQGREYLVINKTAGELVVCFQRT